MDKLETARLIKLMAATWPDFKITEDMVNAWHWMLKDDDFLLACEAVRCIAHSKTDAFAPKIQELIREMKRLVCPKLFMAYEQAQAVDSPILRRARRQVLGDPKPYNPYGNPKELEYNSFRASQEEKAIRATYEALRSSLEHRPVRDLRLIAKGKAACLEAGRADLIDALLGPATYAPKLLETTSQLKLEEQNA